MQSGRTPEQIAEALGLSDFEHAIGGMIEEAKARPEICNGLLAMLLGVNMDSLLARSSAYLPEGGCVAGDINDRVRGAWDLGSSASV